MENQILDSVLDLTELIKDEIGFVLKAYLYHDESDDNDYRKAQLLKHDIVSLPAATDENFSMDVKMELKPNTICDFIQQKDTKDHNLIMKDLMFNDKATSDFTIKLDVPIENENESGDEKFFYVHSTILASKSDYFRTLLNSNMLESQNKCLKLVDISYFILENLFLYIYTDKLENIIDLDDWVGLLYAASRFLMPQLIQICELSIRKFVNFENVDEVENIAYECGTLQLAKYCEMFEIKKDDENELKSKCKEEYKEYSTNIVTKFKNMFSNFAQQNEKV